MATALAIVGAFLVYLEIQSSKTANRADVAVTNIHQSVQRVDQLAHDIQQQRFAATVSNCLQLNAQRLETNRRHDNTVKRLKASGLQFEKANPARKAEIQAQISSSIGLINALSPERPGPRGKKAVLVCEAKARTFTKSSSKKKPVKKGG
jgi:hypothetical protein